MNSTATALTFQSKTFDVVQRKGQMWLTLPDIADVLYREGGDQSDGPLFEGGVTSGPPFANAIRQVQKIYQNHADEFTASMTRMIRKKTAGGMQSVRVFSLRGAHLLAMFARTSAAKRFRRWVLDILDRQIDGLATRPTNSPQLDEQTVRDIESLCRQAEFLRSWWERFAPAIRIFNRKVAGNVHDNFVHAATTSRSLVRTLGLPSTRDYAQNWPWEAGFSEKAEYIAARKVRA